MAEDAITDEVADLSLFKEVRIRANDPRAKEKRPIRVFSFEEMHAFAKAAGDYEAMIRLFTRHRPEVRRGLAPPPEDSDGETLQVRRTAHEGEILEGTKTDDGEINAGRTVPVPRSSPGCSKPRFRSTAPIDLIFTIRPAACGASATSIAMSEGQRSRPRA